MQEAGQTLKNRNTNFESSSWERERVRERERERKREKERECYRESVGDQPLLHGRARPESERGMNV